MEKNNYYRVYLCCQNHRKPFIKRRLLESSINPLFFMDRIEDSDIMLCVGNIKHDPAFREEILHANNIGVRVDYLDENLLPESLIDDILDNKLANEKYRTDHDYGLDREL